MNMRTAVLLISLLWLLGGVAPVRGQVPPGFEVIQITDDPDYDGPPSINNCGQVVFSKRIGNDFNHEEIFLWDNGTLIQITDDDHRDAFPKINDQGTIVWSRTTGGVDTHFEVARWSGGEIEILTDTPSQSEVAGEINSHGHVAWSRYIGGDCARNDLYFFDGEVEHQITDDMFSNQGGAINDSDQITWTKYNFCVAPWAGIIMLYNDDVVSQLASDGTQIAGPDIAADGTIVWGGPPVGIEQWKDGVRTVLVPFGEKPEINARGQVIFNCSPPPEGQVQVCLFDGQDVIQITALPRANLPSSINDSGEIAVRSWPLPTTFDSDIHLIRPTVFTPDVDVDGRVLLSDYARWTMNFSGPGLGLRSCESHRCDFDHSGHVDLIDFSRLQRLLEGE